MTVEITDGQHRALTALATLRGVRGFSPFVQEALDLYLRDLSGDEVDILLGLEGSLTEDEAQQMSAAIDQAWTSWRTAP